MQRELLGDNVSYFDYPQALLCNSSLKEFLTRNTDISMVTMFRKIEDESDFVIAGEKEDGQVWFSNLTGTSFVWLLRTGE